MIFIEISMKFHVFTKQKTNVIFKVNFMKTLVGAIYPPQQRIQLIRRMALYLVISSPMDDPARFGYLHTSLSMLSVSLFVYRFEFYLP